jgi:hypothetical protein
MLIERGYKENIFAQLYNVFVFQDKGYYPGVKKFKKLKGL